MVEERHRQLADDAGHDQRNAETFARGPVRNGTEPAETQAIGQESFRSYLSAIRVSPHFFRQHRLEKNAGLTPTPAEQTISLALAKATFDPKGFALIDKDRALAP